MSGKQARRGPERHAGGSWDTAASERMAADREAVRAATRAAHEVLADLRAQAAASEHLAARVSADLRAVRAHLKSHDERVTRELVEMIEQANGMVSARAEAVAADLEQTMQEMARIASVRDPADLIRLVLESARLLIAAELEDARRTVIEAMERATGAAADVLKEAGPQISAELMRRFIGAYGDSMLPLDEMMNAKFTADPRPAVTIGMSIRNGRLIIEEEHPGGHPGDILALPGADRGNRSWPDRRAAAGKRHGSRPV